MTDDDGWMYHQDARDQAVALGLPVGLAIIVLLIAGLVACVVVFAAGLIYEYAYGFVAFIVAMLVWAATGVPV